MKKTFINILIKLAEKDKNIYLLTGDLGFSFFEEFAKKFPARFINCGVAEQNMMGVAAGLALEGKKVYVYSIIPFAIFRCFEQIRNDICYNNLDVKIIGGGAGFSYGTHGSSHFAIEDISVLRPLPNISIFSPADPTEMEQLVLQSYKTKNPAYIRMEKNAEKLYSANYKIIMAKPSVFKDGKDGAIISAGSSLLTAIKAEKKLSEKGYNLKIISLHTIKPIDENALIKELKNKKNIFTLEEHRLTGGLGDAVAEVLLKNDFKDFALKSFGLPAGYRGITGSQEYLRKYYKLDEVGVYNGIIKILEKNKK